MGVEKVEEYMGYDVVKGAVTQLWANRKKMGTQKGADKRLIAGWSALKCP